MYDLVQVSPQGPQNDDKQSCRPDDGNKQRKAEGH